MFANQTQRKEKNNIYINVRHKRHMTQTTHTTTKERHNDTPQQPPQQTPPTKKKVYLGEWGCGVVGGVSCVICVIYVVLFVVCVDLCRICRLHRYFAVLCRYYFVCFVYHYVSIYKHNNKPPSPPLKKKYLKEVLLKVLWVCLLCHICRCVSFFIAT